MIPPEIQKNLPSGVDGERWPNLHRCVENAEIVGDAAGMVIFRSPGPPENPKGKIVQPGSLGFGTETEFVPYEHHADILDGHMRGWDGIEVLSDRFFVVMEWTDAQAVAWMDDPPELETPDQVRRSLISEFRRADGRGDEAPPEGRRTMFRSFDKTDGT